MEVAIVALSLTNVFWRFLEEKLMLFYQRNVLNTNTATPVKPRLASTAPTKCISLTSLPPLSSALRCFQTVLRNTQWQRCSKKSGSKDVGLYPSESGTWGWWSELFHGGGRKRRKEEKREEMGGKKNIAEVKVSVKFCPAPWKKAKTMITQLMCPRKSSLQ